MSDLANVYYWCIPNLSGSDIFWMMVVYAILPPVSSVHAEE
jgi:hypothetical protein